jgi:hypothetical protein
MESERGERERERAHTWRNFPSYDKGSESWSTKMKKYSYYSPQSINKKLHFEKGWQASGCTLTLLTAAFNTDSVHQCGCGKCSSVCPDVY